MPKYRRLRVDDDGLVSSPLRAKRIAGHLLERDLLRPTDVHEAVERLGDRGARDLGGHLPAGDRLDQRVGNAHLVPDDQRLGDRSVNSANCVARTIVYGRPDAVITFSWATLARR